MNPTIFPPPPIPTKSPRDVRPWNRPGYTRDAELSDDGRYRWSLQRGWPHPDGSLDWFTVVGLNPSTADARQDDPTIRRCVDFADICGFGALGMLSAYAYRATDPAEMFRAVDPVGPGTDERLLRWLSTVPWAVCAWGGDLPVAREQEVLDIFRQARCEPRVFGLTKTGAPRHPLYQPRSARPVPWDVR